MPKPIDWTPLVPHALAALRQMTDSVVDRSTLEGLLKIHRRTAIRLLHQFGARQFGKTLLLPRERLIGELEAYLPQNAPELPGLRTPSQIRRLHREAGQFRFADVRSADRRTADRLPPGVQIASGRLTVEATDLRDLCAQLWTLLETCKDDWEGVERRLRSAV